MENTEKFRMRKYSKKTGTNIYAAPMHGVNKLHFELYCRPISFRDGLKFINTNRNERQEKYKGQVAQWETIAHLEPNVPAIKGM